MIVGAMLVAAMLCAVFEHGSAVKSPADMMLEQFNGKFSEKLNKIFSDDLNIMTPTSSALQSESSLGNIRGNGESLLATTTYTYFNNFFYESPGCAVLKELVTFTTGVCVPAIDGGVQISTIQDTTTSVLTSTKATYTTSNCSDIPSTDTITSVPGTCETVYDDDDGGFSTTTYDKYSGSQSQKTYSSSAVISKAFMTEEGCLTNSGATAGIAYVPQSFGGCISSSTDSYEILCENDVLIFHFYATTACSGTPTIMPLTTDCSLTDYGYIYGTCQNSGSSDKCFSGFGTVSMEDGSEKMISEVAVGDRILSYSPASKSFLYSDVVYIPHEKNEKSSWFTRVLTVDGREIMLTPAHLILSGACGSTLDLKSASSISVGDCLLDHQGKHTEVRSTSSVQMKGVYSVVTQEEYIVVSGFVSSPFAMNHYVANKYYNIHRMLYAYMPSMLKSSWMSSIQGMASYVASIVGSF